MKIDELMHLNVPDDTVIKMGDRDVKWGDLKANIATLSQERDGWYQQAQQHQNESARLSESVAELLKAGSAAAASEPQQQGNPRDMFKQALQEMLKGDEDKDDPYLSPLVERKAKKLLQQFKETELEAATAPYKQSIEQLNQGVQLLAGQLGVERGLRLYKEAGDWPEGMDFSTATRAAVERKIFVPGTTYPDYANLNNQLMGQSRYERHTEDIRKQEREKVEKEFRSQYGANLIMPNRPGMGAGSFGKPTIDTEGKSQEQILDEALRAGIEEAIQEGAVNGR